VRRKDFGNMDCSIAKALDVVGDPWTLLIVRDAILGVHRFEDFHRRLGTPRATLAARLDHLIDTGVLAKDADAGYRLTHKGRALRPVVLTLMQWGDAWVRDDAPPTTLTDGDTGSRIDPVLVDRNTGTPLDELRVRAVGPVTAGLSRGDDPAL
jgi:DNA-binding HxlR family transcriptional regulator